MGYIRNKEIIQSKIGDEVVMLDMDSGYYFGLNSVASDIWALMENEIAFDLLIDTLMAKFEVDRSVCESDTQELIDQMLVKKIIRKIEP